MSTALTREEKVEQLANHYSIPLPEADRLLANMEANA